jgi:hypothetical protein
MFQAMAGPFACLKEVLNRRRRSGFGRDSRFREFAQASRERFRSHNRGARPGEHMEFRKAPAEAGVRIERWQWVLLVANAA